MLTWTSTWPVLLGSAVTAVAWGLIAFLLAKPTGRVNIVDTLWPLGFCAIAIESAIVAALTGNTGTDPLRTSLLLAGVLIWGLRLGYFVGRRSAGKGDDQRYVDLLDSHDGHRSLVALTYVYLPQTVILYVVSATVQIGLVEHGGVGWLGWVGVAVWLIGLTFEAVGDHQMNAFRSDPDKHGLIDEGLWRWTRHPNYFGDAAVWTGLYLLSAEHFPGSLTFVSPMVMTYLLRNGTGKRLLERSMSRRDGWEDYAARVNGFFPLPPGWKQRLTSLLHAG